MGTVMSRVPTMLRGLAVGAGALLSVALPAAASAAETRLVVRSERGVSASQRADVRADADVQLSHRVAGLTGTEVVTVPAAQAKAALSELNDDPRVRYAVRDVRTIPASVPDDAGWASQWDMRTMKVHTAWDLALGAGQVVAIADTGIQLDHQDLAGRIATNPGEMGSGRQANGVDDDGDGFVDNWRGWDFVDGDGDASDEHGHGTHVAGTVAAEQGNTVGVSGVAPGAHVMAVRVLGADGSGWMSDVAAGFDYAAKHGARVVNASLGSPSDYPPLGDVVAGNPQTLFVVAAGNGGSDGVGDDNEITPQYPCNQPQANLLCVGATNSADRRASFSNYGATSVDVFAPGQSIYSTTLGAGNTYGYMSGTSMAAPHVAGQAALVLSHRPGTPAVAVKQAIMDSADRLPDLAGRAVAPARSSGLASLNAIAGVPAPAPAPPAPEPALPLPPYDQQPDGDPQEQAPALAAPRISKVRVGFTRSRCGGAKACRKPRASVTVSAQADVDVTIAQKVCKRSRCRYRVAARASASASGAGTITLAPAAALAAGRYRLLVAAANAAGDQQKDYALSIPRR
jgi:thermitase